MRDRQRAPARPKGRRIEGEEHLVRRPGSTDWHLDITINGHRLRRSCGTDDKGKAAALAVREHDALWRRVMLGERPVETLSLGVAFARFYDEVARGTPYGEGAQRHQMATMLELLPDGIGLAELDDAVVNDMVQALRRREIVPHNAPEAAPSRKKPRTFSGATINRYVTTLSGVCTRARKVWKVSVGEWDRSLHQQEESRGREVFLEVDQARALCDAVIAHARPIFLLALATGLRKANVHGLVWESVSLDLGRIVLLTKGDKPHAVSLPGPLVDMLAQLEPEPAKRRGAVFWFGNPAVGCSCATCIAAARGVARGERRGIQSTKRAFATAAKACGLTDMPAGRLRFHDLRHSVASWVLASGGDLRVVQEQLGHADIATTARYAHLVQGRRETVVNAATAGLLGPPAITEEKKKA